MTARLPAAPALLTLALAVGACGGAEPSPMASASAAPTERRGPVVYGSDDRVEWYAVADVEVQERARATAAAMIGWDVVSLGETGAEVGSYATLAESFGLCAGERFSEQPTSSVCSGTLIDVDLLLTAGHCVTSLTDCAGSAWIFDYLYEADGVPAVIDRDDVYRCVDLVVASGRDLAPGLDLAIIQLDRAVVGRTPATVSRATTIADAAPLTLTGFPSGLPLKVSTGEVHLPRADGDYFTAAIDSFHGDSGSGVRNAEHEVVGVLVDGAEDYASAGTCTVVNVLNPRDAEESVMFAHHALEALCSSGFPSRALCGGVGRCGDGFCTDGETAASCKRDCDQLFSVPAEWTCNAAWYDAGDDCDCACGAYDPDCGDIRLDVLNCVPGSACKRDGTCAEPLPATWVCPAWRYAEGDECDCDCGAPDPDCQDTRATLAGCAPGGECRADGTCTVSYPEAWSCRQRFYDVGDGCDCGCGAFDPDCADEGAAVYGCAPGSACLGDGSCAEPIPEAWVCSGEHYGTGKACDCRCGAPDPDCALGLPVNNCESGETCDAEGWCTREPVVVEPGPEPGPEVVEPAPEAVEDLEDGDVAEPASSDAEALEDTGGTAPDGVSAEDGSTGSTDTNPAPDATGARFIASGGSGCAGGGPALVDALSALFPFSLLALSARLRARRGRSERGRHATRAARQVMP